MGNLLKSETFRFRVSLNNLFITNDKSKDEKSIRRDGAGGRSITFFHPSTPNVMMDSEKGFLLLFSLFSHFPLSSMTRLFFQWNSIGLFSSAFSSSRGRETEDFPPLYYFS